MICSIVLGMSNTSTLGGKPLSAGDILSSRSRWGSRALIRVSVILARVIMCPVKMLDHIDRKLKVVLGESRYLLPGTSHTSDIDHFIDPLDLVICQAPQFFEVVYPLVICKSSCSIRYLLNSLQ